jgi:hypothetical protein
MRTPGQRFWLRFFILVQWGWALLLLMGATTCAAVTCS